MMVRKDGAAIRKERIQEIARKIHSLLHQHGELSLSKTVSGLEYEFGLTKDKTMEYLHVLENLDHFILDIKGDKIKNAQLIVDLDRKDKEANVLSG